MFEVLVVLSKSHSEFLEVRLFLSSLSLRRSTQADLTCYSFGFRQEELGTLIELDRKMFVGLYEGTKTLLVELDASS